MTATSGSDADEATVVTAEAAFEERLRCYRELGHDREAAVRWVVDAAGKLAAPVLDIGTGKGLLAVELASRGLSVTSVDPSRDDQVMAARRAERHRCADAIRFVHGKAETLEEPPDRFGSAAMMNVLHHLESVDDLFDRISTLVRPGGQFLVAEFTPEGFAVVAAAHRAEGREHEVSPVSSRVARDALLRRGWCQVLETTGHLHEVALYSKK